LNGLYDKTCPNYATAYATKMVLEQQNMASTVATAGVVARNDPANTPAPTTNSEGTVAIAVVADSNVNSVITSQATSASPAQAATATVPLVAAPPPPSPPPAPQQSGPGERKQDGPSDKPSGPSQMASGPQQDSGGKEQPKPTARQEIQAKREQAAKAKAVEDGKNLAGEMGKAADMESQKQVQNVVIQAMGFTPGFDAYSKQIIVQQQFYKPFTVYNNQKNIDNRANLRMFGGTDKLHNEMVDSQYNKGN
jgi:hypothetical protein